MQKKHLYRSNSDRIIAGVCGGLGEYFNTSAWLFRIIFLLFQGSLVLYILLWIFVSENPTQNSNPTHTPVFLKIIFILLAILFGYFFLQVLYRLIFG